MQIGVILPDGTADEQLQQAVMAEAAGWDGVFVWDAAYGVDAWTLLGAMASATRRIRLGTLLTPLPWRRPWKLASQVATLDQLSGGRAIRTVGLGALNEDLPVTGEITDVSAGCAPRRGDRSAAGAVVREPNASRQGLPLRASVHPRRSRGAPRRRPRRP